MRNAALTSLDLARDAILFGLLMNEGICLAEIARSFGLETMEFEPVSVFLNRLEREGLGHWQTDWFRLPRREEFLRMRLLWKFQGGCLNGRVKPWSADPDSRATLLVWLV